MNKKTHEPIPKDFEVQPLKAGENPAGKATCGHCGLSWDDDKPTMYTPVPSARCPFEYFHLYDTRKVSIKTHRCYVSTGIHEGLTFGSGELDDYGYWDVPCLDCARAFEKKMYLPFPSPEDQLMRLIALM